jgi:Tol biopolymer transport system component
MPLTVGTCLGPYEIVAAIGAGGMGEVYRARDPRLNRDVAIKVLTRAGHDPARQRRLTEEARAASALNHPNIVTVYDVGEQADVPFIVSELVDGRSLRTLLLRAPLPVREVFDLAIQMADGLAAAHQAGIVHRDFKPDNVMVTREGRVKILDFGLALVGPQEGVLGGESTMTQPNLIVGTVPYMSPEQARGATVTFRTDQFSLGLTLYEMVTGKRTFQAETAAQVLAAIIEDEPEPIVKLNARVPAPLRWVIERCLAKDARQRYDSTTDLARELCTLRDKLSEFAPATDAVPALSVRRRFAKPLLAGALVLAAGLAAGLVLAGGDAGTNFDQYRFTPFAADAGYQSSPAWSPDGKTIAYVAAVDGVLQVFTKAIGSPHRNQVTHERFDCRQPFWAADGQRLYYLSQYQDRQGLYSISVAGGEHDPVLPNVSRAALSPDGKTMALWRAADNDYAGLYSLWLSSPPGDAPVQYKRGPFGSARFVEGTLRFSPDGTKLGVFTGAKTHGEITQDEFWIVPLIGGDPRVVNAPDFRVLFVGGFSWLPDSRHVLGAMPVPGPGVHLWLMDTENGDARLILPSGGTESDPAVSPDGRQIATSLQQANYDVYRVSVDRPVLEPMIASARNEMDPAWSLETSKMALTTDRSGVTEIWLADQYGQLDRSPLVKPSDFPTDTYLFGSPQFSRDGKRIAYFRRGLGTNRIWISPVAEGPPMELSPGQDEQDMPTWSPDPGSAWIAYAHQSGGTAGTWMLSKIRVGAKTPPVPLARDILPYSPLQWAPSGEWIAFNGQDGLSIVSPDGQTTKVVAEGAWLAFAWSEDSRQLFGIRQSDDYKHLTFTSVDVRSGVERVLAANLAPMPVANDPVRGFTRVSATTFLTSIVRVSSDIWLLDGFNPPREGFWARLWRRFRSPGR